MAEIIPFAGRRRPVQQEAEDQEPKEAEGKKPKSKLRFTSVDAIYDEEEVMIVHDDEEVSVASFKLAMKTAGRDNVLRNFETFLTEERAKYISDQYKSPSARQEALIALAKHAYTEARQLEHVELMDWATAELSRGLGVSQAMIIIENIQLKDRIRTSE